MQNASHKIFLSMLMFYLFLLAGISFALAQQDDATIPPLPEVTQDENILPADLGVSDPRILPNNPIYPVKNLFRGIQSVFTFNPVAKAELKLKFANEKIIEAKKLAGTTQNPETIKNALSNYQDEISRLSNAAKTSIAGDPKFEKFLDKLVDNQIKHQKLLGRLEQKLPEEVFDKIAEVKEENAEKLAEIPLRFENADKFKERMIKIMDRQEGSEFKNFKNLEVLKEIEAKVPEQAREAIKQARENATKRLRDDLNQMSPENQEKFKDYIGNIGGNEVRHLEIITEMGTEILPENLRNIIEEGKGEVLDGIGLRLRGLKENKHKEDIIKHLEEGEIEDLRIMRELENNLPPDVIDPILEMKNRAINHFRQKIESADTAEAQQKLLDEVKRIPDIKQFEVLNDIEPLIPADRQDFWNNLKTKTEEAMEQRINAAKDAAEKQRIIESIIGDQPEHITIIKETLPLVLRLEVLKKQAEHLKERLEISDDPARLEILKRKIEDNSTIKEEIQKITPDILERIDQRQEIISGKITKELAESQIRKAEEMIKKVMRRAIEVSAPEKEGNVKGGVADLLDNANKHLEKAKQALNEGKFGEAFGQATASLHNAENALRILTGNEIKKEIIEERLEKTKEIIGEMRDRIEGLVPEIKKPADNTVCTQFTPPHPDFCEEGKIIWKKDEKGCLLPPKCVLKTSEPEPIDNVTAPKEKICLQVLTPAKNHKTGECQIFRTSCLPDGWEKTNTCLSDTEKSGEKITRKVGEQEGSFLVQKINPDSVNGLWYQAYPIVNTKGELKTLHIGDDIGYTCEGISEKLVNINFSDQTITFNKIVGQRPYGGCPICLAGNSLIDTPSGLIPVKDLQFGISVWTTDKTGQRVSGVITKTSKVLVSPTHQMVHLVLNDGRELFVSPGHPTIDGRTVGDLAHGDLYDGASVVNAERVPYGENATYDLLPSGDTGFYWANGILIGSTLR